MRAAQRHPVHQLLFLYGNARPQPDDPRGRGTTAIITLNVPNPYATGNDIPGGMFGVTVNGKVSPVVASFTYNETPSSFGRIPTTLVVGIPLGNTAQTIQAVWAGVRGSTVIIDSPASRSAVF